MMDMFQVRKRKGLLIEREPQESHGVVYLNRRKLLLQNHQISIGC